MDNVHDNKSSNMSRLNIPVASIGSTTNTLDPSANLSGNLKITLVEFNKRCSLKHSIGEAKS
jgi:hypothetical protein